MTELKEICPGAQEMPEGGIRYVYLPSLRLPCSPRVLDGLLCLDTHSGYTTRLFLSVQVPSKGANWTCHHILGRAWHTWSWNNVPGSLRPVEILLNHLGALR